MSIACALALASFGHSLLVLAPGSAVACHVTVTVWPTVVGTVTWSWAAVNAGKAPRMRAHRIATDPTTASRRATTSPPRPHPPSLRDERFQTCRGSRVPASGLGQVVVDGGVGTHRGVAPNRSPPASSERPLSYLRVAAFRQN